MAAFVSALNRLNPVDHLLVYTNSEQLEHVQEILNAEGLVQHKFTITKIVMSEIILTEFEDGGYDALVAMKCLDEGSTFGLPNKPFLMSILGIQCSSYNAVVVCFGSSRKEKSTIFDFIVVPTTNPDAQLVESEGILRKNCGGLRSLQRAR